MNSNSSSNIRMVPDHYTAVTPWIISPSSEKVIEFLKAAFEAEEIPNSKIKNEHGVIIHVVVKIGDAMLMLFDSRAGWGPSPAFLNVYVRDADQVYQNALQLGATAVTKPTTLWFGEKVCRILDPFGNLWWINERVEEVDFTQPDEIGKRASTEEAVQGITYIQQSLDAAMKTQKKFFEDRSI